MYCPRGGGKNGTRNKEINLHPHYNAISAPIGIELELELELSWAIHSKVVPKSSQSRPKISQVIPRLSQYHPKVIPRYKSANYVRNSTIWQTNWQTNWLTNQLSNQLTNQVIWPGIELLQEAKNQIYTRCSNIPRKTNIGNIIAQI